MHNTIRVAERVALPAVFLVFLSLYFSVLRP